MVNAFNNAANDMDRKEKTLKRLARKYTSAADSVALAKCNYNNAKCEMTRLGIWVTWCNAKGYDPKHNADDLFA